MQFVFSSCSASNFCHSLQKSADSNNPAFLITASSVLGSILNSKSAANLNTLKILAGSALILRSASSILITRFSISDNAPKES